MNTIDDIKTFLANRYAINEKVIYIPNTGNAGDTIIAYGTIRIFSEINLSWTIGDTNIAYEGENIILGGGGNFVSLYSHIRNMLLKYKDKNKILLLPHTIINETETIAKLGDNVTLICREEKSFRYVRGVSNYPENIYLSKDMAFYISDFISKEGTGYLNAFRTDSEKTKIAIPSDNVDLSITMIKPGNTSNVSVIAEVTANFFNYLSRYEVVNTNRLHVCIAAALLNKTVNFYPNGYYKNKAVYDYSLKQFPNVTYHDIY